jgi:hypothetical protein
MKFHPIFFFRTLLAAAGLLAALPAYSDVDPREVQLSHLRMELEVMRETKGDNHPDVRDMRTRIEVMEREFKKAQAKAKVVSINFSGGTIAQLCAAVPQESQGFNILGEKADLQTELPPFQIRDAEPDAVAGALRFLLSSRGYTLNPTGHNVFVLAKVQPEKPRTRSKGFESFQLSKSLKEQSIDDIIGTIRLAWEMDPAHTPDGLQLKFHPSTAILLVSGGAEALDVTRKVIGSLKAPASPRNSAPDEKTSPPSPATESKK